MIQIVLTRRDSQIESVSVSGHSGSAEYGRDLICAAVSAIVFGTCNALDELGSDAECSVLENEIQIDVVTNDRRTQLILETMLVQLRTVQEGNETFVKIRKTEV